MERSYLATVWRLGTLILFAATILSTALCQRHGDLRLTGYGANPLAGRLEIYYEDQWGAVCGDAKFNTLTASVACHQLGLGPAVSVIMYPDLRFGIGSYSVISDVTCTGIESHILQCHTSRRACPVYMSVGIICSRNSLPYSGAVRLVGSEPFSSSGFLQMFIYGQWRTVCGSSFDQFAANSACRQLGYTSGAYNIRNLLTGTPTWMLSSSCGVNSVCLSTCTNLNDTAIATELCSTRISLSCVFNASQNISSGNQAICERTMLPPYEGDVRIDSSIQNGLQGIPEIYHNGDWRMTCSHESFSIKDADVLCKQLSYSFAVRYDNITRSDSFGALISCSGLEVSVRNCSVLATRQCSEFVQIKCNNEEPPYGSLTLLNGAGSAGSLYVFDGQLFHPVCDASFGLKELYVACRQLGYDRGLQIVNNSLYGGPVYSNLLSYSFSCTGSERYLLDCQQVTNGTCRYPYDTVAIQCGTAGISGSSKPRLMNGNATSGRLEVDIGNEFGTVCGLGFNEFAAHVACREMGFETATGYTMTKMSISYPPIKLMSLDCYGFETDLLSCPHSIADNGTCRHQNDVYLYCSQEYPIPDGSLRVSPSSMSDSKISISGRLEISFYGIWMSVCGLFFNTEAANVACSQMGYSHAESYHSNTCNNTTGCEKVFLAETRCTGNELKLIECEHEVHNHRFCTSNVGITCAVKQSSSSIAPSLSSVANTPTGIPVGPSPTSSFFLPISEVMFYSIAGGVAILILLCLVCTVICCCVCYRRKRTVLWETQHTHGIDMTEDCRNSYNIYDSPHFSVPLDKDPSLSWAPYGRGEDETDFGLEEPPHYDEINFQSVPCRENHYETTGGDLQSMTAINASDEKMLDKGTFQSSNLW